MMQSRRIGPLGPRIELLAICALYEAGVLAIAYGG